MNFRIPYALLTGAWLFGAGWAIMEIRAERRSRSGWKMAVLAVLWPVMAWSAGIYEGNNVVVQINDRPCPNDGMAAILSRVVVGAPSFEAITIWSDGVHKACWVKNHGRVYIVDDEDRLGYISEDLFKEAKEI